MQDLTVNELADEIHDELLNQDIDISRTAVRHLTRHFFKYVEKIAQNPEVRLNFRTRDINYIYPIFDVKRLCEELATGEPNVITIDHLIRKKKLSKRVQIYLRTKKTHMEEELE